MAREKTIPGLGLTAREFKSIENYQKSRNSAVLTIMFTDIQGFTSLTEERGETYVHKLHAEHDTIVVGCVERDGAGIVIKYIGDSVMAVFSEPTAAVERALQIQQKLHDFNRDHPEFENLYVRIGLHMGQTVLENKMHVDLFGRHVNKASRIESLADGGHIYISYPVFDSVKSWLIESGYAAYKHHGQYILKGIEKPEDIFEVYNTGLTTPKAPRGGRKKEIRGRHLVLGAAAAGAVLIAVLFVPELRISTRDTSTAVPLVEPQTESIMPNDPDVAKPDSAKPAVPLKDDAQPPAAQQAPAIEEPEVFFISLNALEPILDLETPLVLVQIEGSDTTKKSLIPIQPGRHIVHFIVSDLVYYFFEFDAVPGTNFIPAKFVRSELPSTQINLFLEDREELSETRSTEGDYFYFTKGNLEKVSLTARLEVTVSGKKISPGTTRFTIDYSVRIDDQEVSRDMLVVDSPMNSNASKRSDPIILFDDDYHTYQVRYSVRNDSIQVNIDASFKDLS